MVKLKTIDYRKIHQVDFDKFDVVIVVNQYAHEYKVLKNEIIVEDETKKHDLSLLSSYILECHDAYNGVSEVNLHEHPLYL